MFFLKKQIPNWDFLRSERFWSSCSSSVVTSSSYGSVSYPGKVKDREGNLGRGALQLGSMDSHNICGYCSRLGTRTDYVSFLKQKCDHNLKSDKRSLIHSQTYQTISRMNIHNVLIYLLVIHYFTLQV